MCVEVVTQHQFVCVMLLEEHYALYLLCYIIVFIVRVYVYICDSTRKRALRVSCNILCIIFIYFLCVCVRFHKSSYTKLEIVYSHHLDYIF